MPTQKDILYVKNVQQVKAPIMELQLELQHVQIVWRGNILKKQACA
jgi:hypothetical protein